MSDSDMINYGFPPQRHWKGPRLVSFEGHTPSLVTGSTRAFQAVVDAFLDVAAHPDSPCITKHNGRNHTSDMIILSIRRNLFMDLKYPAHLNRNNPHMNESVVLHFARNDVTNFAGHISSKAELARILRSFPE
jgi:hypothetical protein